MIKWRKSSFSGASNCVEVSLPQWRKADASASNGCVEVAIDPTVVLVRDSKAPDGPHLAFSHSEWTAFLAGVVGGEFDLEQPDADEDEAAPPPPPPDPGKDWYYPER